MDWVYDIIHGKRVTLYLIEVFILLHHPRFRCLEFLKLEHLYDRLPSQLCANHHVSKIIAVLFLFHLLHTRSPMYISHPKVIQFPNPRLLSNKIFSSVRPAKCQLKPSTKDLILASIHLLPTANPPNTQKMFQRKVSSHLAILIAVEKHIHWKDPPVDEVHRYAPLPPLPHVHWRDPVVEGTYRYPSTRSKTPKLPPTLRDPPKGCCSLK